jgi:hypothetical protein
MKLHMMPQYSPDWWAIRRGKFTASEIGPFVINAGKVAETARLNLICKKLGELGGDEESGFQTDAMKRGSALEPIARAEYARIMRRPVFEAGFAEHPVQPLGFSPDGLVLKDDPDMDPSSEEMVSLLEYGCEIKAPLASTQVKYLLKGGLPDEYKCQVHMSMALAGTPHWDFFSFCPRVLEWAKTRDAWTVLDWEPGDIPPHYVRVYRDAFTAELEQGLYRLCDEYRDTKSRMAAIWAKNQPIPSCQ